MASKKRQSPFSFLGGFVQNRNLGRVIAIGDAPGQEDSGWSLLMKWTRENREWGHYRLEWTAIGLIVRPTGSEELYALGVEGEVLVSGDAGVTEEHVLPGKQGPEGRGDMRDLRWIGNHLYAAGMTRQVYRREGPNEWSRRDEGVALPLGTLDTKGFNAIDGSGDDDFYAVGFEGEIWRCVKGRWRRLDSPTNVVLTQLRAIEPGLAYACGQRGLLLRGRGDHWEVIRQTATREDLWGIEWFGGHLYACSDEALYRLEGDELVPVTVGNGKATFLSLHANDGVMWSFGTKHVLWTEDAAKWRDVTPRAD